MQTWRLITGLWQGCVWRRYGVFGASPSSSHHRSSLPRRSRWWSTNFCGDDVASSVQRTRACPILSCVKEEAIGGLAQGDAACDIFRASAGFCVSAHRPSCTPAAVISLTGWSRPPRCRCAKADLSSSDCMVQVAASECQPGAHVVAAGDSSAAGAGGPRVSADWPSRSCCASVPMRRGSKALASVHNSAARQQAGTASGRA